MQTPRTAQSPKSHCAIRAVSTNMMTLRHKPEEENRNRSEIREMMEEVRRSILSVLSKEKNACTEDSAGSSEEMESPRLVRRWRRGGLAVRFVDLEDQRGGLAVLRIREEDSQSDL